MLKHWPHMLAQWAGMPSYSFDLTLFYMGGNNVPPLVDYRSSIVDVCPKLADFSWLCSFQYKKGPGEAIFGFFLKISKILAWMIFSDFDPKGGPFYARIKKSKKSNFFCSKSHLFCLNMTFTCSKLSFKVSDMPCNQVSSILKTFI